MKILVSENQFKFLFNLITENDDRVKENVMFVGDSLSAGKGATWNYLLEKSHPEWNVTHVVEGGKRTDWMLNNMLPKLKEKKYDWKYFLPRMQLVDFSNNENESKKQVNPEDYNQLLIYLNFFI